MTDHGFAYVECDVPEGLTLREWRHATRTQRRRSPWWQRLLGLPVGATAAAGVATGVDRPAGPSGR